MNKYDSIINMEHHRSKKRKHMSMINRAAQFSAFEPLEGHKEAIDDAAKKNIEKQDYTEAE